MRGGERSGDGRLTPTGDEGRDEESSEPQFLACTESALSREYAAMASRMERTLRLKDVPVK